MLEKNLIYDLREPFPFSVLLRPSEWVVQEAVATTVLSFTATLSLFAAYIIC